MLQDGQFLNLSLIHIYNNYESQMVLTYLTSAPISQREKINGSWGKWKVFVTKSDLANKTKSGSATISTKQNDSTALQIRFDEPFPSRQYAVSYTHLDVYKRKGFRFIHR